VFHKCLNGVAGDVDFDRIVEEELDTAHWQVAIKGGYDSASQMS